MIYLITLIAVIFCVYAKFKLKWTLVDEHAIKTFGVVFIILLMILGILTTILIIRVEITNALKSQNINMIPMSVLEGIYYEKVIQLQKVQNRIEEAVNKNQFQVEIDNLNGFKIYTMPMSSAGIGFQGFGDIEKGGAEKLKLLEPLIEKQNVIAEELIKAKIELSHPDYYKRNAEIMTFENSLLDGWLIKLFSISNNVDFKIIENRVYYPINDTTTTNTK